MCNPEEVVIGLRCAQAIHDTIAWPAFVIGNTHTGGSGDDPLLMSGMLEALVGMLEGWQLEESAAPDYAGDCAGIAE